MRRGTGSSRAASVTWRLRVARLGTITIPAPPRWLAQIYFRGGMRA